MSSVINYRLQMIRNIKILDVGQSKMTGAHLFNFFQN
jgi:hypothetical protein